MKKKLLKWALSAMCSVAMIGMLSIGAKAAAGDVAINQTNFPDPVFREYVLKTFDVDGTKGVLSRTERDRADYIYLIGGGVTSLKGIEYLDKLRYMNCEDNKLTSLDLSKNPLLVDLNCTDNQLSSLDLSNNTLLEALFCNGNKLTSLNITKCPKLIYLWCRENQLKTLDVTNNPELLYIGCNTNPLIGLNVRNNVKLETLSIYSTQITSIDISQNIVLETIHYDPEKTKLITTNTLAITTQPANKTVTSGATATFKVVATGASLKYQWQKSTDKGVTWANSASTGATTNTLSMATKDSYNGMKFRCVVTDQSGKKVTSNAATLTVTPALAITTQPASKTVTSGATATFKVVATGTDLKYQWQKSTDNGVTWANSASTGATTNTLTMTAKDSYSGMKFRCVVTDQSGKKVTSSAATLTVTAASAITITTQPVSKTVTSGASVTFKVAATGTSLKYQWQKSTDGGKTWVNSASTGATTNTLTMTTKDSYNGMKFRCVVTDQSGKKVTSSAATLTVTAALAITTQPTAKTAAAGTEVIFQIAATGDGLTYQWQKSSDGKNWVNSSSTGAKTNKLTMTVKASFNGLQFRCVVTDKNGKTATSNAVKLTVTAAGAGPVITTQPAAVSTKAGTAAIFKIAATGDGLTYQWQKSSDGKNWVNSSSTGAKTNTLSITTKASFNGLQFRCVVTDKNGKSVISGAAKLTVQ